MAGRGISPAQRMKRFFVASSLALALLIVVAHFRQLPRVQPDAKTGRRLVSLSPTLSELVFRLGAGKELVGVTRFCVYPPEVSKIEKIGDFLNPNVERIVNLDPDLVLAQKWSSSRLVSHLRHLGLQVYEAPSPNSLQDIYGMIGEVGRVLGKSAQAEDLVQALRDRVQHLKKTAGEIEPRPSVYVEIDRPSWTVGSTSFTSEAIDLAGARNIFQDVERPSFLASSEAIIKRNPDVILSLSAPAVEIRQRTGWGRIKAVREGNIIDDFDSNLLTHGNQRLVDGMELLQRRLVSLSRKAKRP